MPHYYLYNPHNGDLWAVSPHREDIAAEQEHLGRSGEYGLRIAECWSTTCNHESLIPAD